MQDFTKMAQGQGNPEDLKKIETPDEELYGQMGMPAGEDDAAIKERLLIMFERLGLMEGLTQDGLLELQQQIDDFIKVTKTKDIEKIQNHPIAKILDKAAKELQAQGQPQQAQAQPAATKDFASMMPPPGGGLGGQ